MIVILSLEPVELKLSLLSILSSAVKVHIDSIQFTLSLCDLLVLQLFRISELSVEYLLLLIDEFHVPVGLLHLIL